MASSLRAARVVGALATRPAPRRFASGIKILEDTGHARENMYWHQEDEKLLRKMIENNPSLDPAFACLKGITEDASHSTPDKVKMIFVKHGIPPVNKALISDIVPLVEDGAK